MYEMKNEMSIMQKGFPEPTLRRLPVYHNYLKRIMESGLESISCTQIANDLNLIPIQVRKDLEVTELSGRPKVGYNVKELINAIETFLGWHNTADAFLIGVGHLGQALLGYQGFSEYGLNIVAAFDIDPQKAGKTISGKKIFSLEKMTELARRMNIRMGILTAPAQAAQQLADLMIRSGITAIWNFAPARIAVPPHVVVQHENLASSLAVLSKKIGSTVEKQ